MIIIDGARRRLTSLCSAVLQDVRRCVAFQSSVSNVTDSVLTRTVAGYVALVVSATFLLHIPLFDVSRGTAIRYRVERHVCLDRCAAVQLTGHPTSQVASWNRRVRQTSPSCARDRSFNTASFRANRLINKLVRVLV